MTNVPHPKNFVGIAAALGAFMMFAFMNMFAKLLADDHHVIEIGFYRNIIALIPFTLYIFLAGKTERLKPKNTKAVLSRAALGTVSLIVTFAAFVAMPMADVTAFLFSTSLMVPVLSIFFLGERVGIPRWTAIIIGFVGVLIMVNPTGQVNTNGVLLALAAASMHAVMGVLLRYIGRTDNALTSTFYFMLVGTILTGFAMPFIGQWPSPDNYGLLLGVGITGALAQFCLAAAFQYSEASTVTIFNYSGIIWATLIGYMVWGEFPDNAIITGGAIVIASNLYIVWRENQLRKKQLL